MEIFHQPYFSEFHGTNTEQQVQKQSQQLFLVAGSVILFKIY